MRAGVCASGLGWLGGWNVGWWSASARPAQEKSRVVVGLPFFFLGWPGWLGWLGWPGWLGWRGWLPSQPSQPKKKVGSKQGYPTFSWAG